MPAGPHMHEYHTWTTISQIHIHIHIHRNNDFLVVPIKCGARSGSPQLEKLLTNFASSFSNSFLV